MLAEIEEQPAALERTFRQGLAQARRFRAWAGRRDFRLVILVARGTSDNAATFGRYLIEITTGLPVSLAAPSVHTLYRANLRLNHALVVGISQSGEGTDIHMVLESCRRRGAFTLGMTNEPGSTMAQLVEECWFVRAGKERSVAATKTYTGQLLLEYLLAWALGAAMPPEKMARLAAHAGRALRLRPEIEALVERYRGIERAIVVARGLNYANAYELALKLMEVCYVVTERFSSADFLHGPIALIEPRFPVFVFAPPGPTLAGQREILKKLAGLKADTLVLTSEPLGKLATRLIRLPALGDDDLYTPIPYIIPGQLFAALLALAKGINPDAPRQLTKITKTV